MGVQPTLAVPYAHRSVEEEYTAMVARKPDRDLTEKGQIAGILRVKYGRGRYGVRAVGRTAIAAPVWRGRDACFSDDTVL